MNEIVEQIAAIYGISPEHYPYLRVVGKYLVLESYLDTGAIYLPTVGNLSDMVRVYGWRVIAEIILRLIQDKQRLGFL